MRSTGHLRPLCQMRGLDGDAGMKRTFAFGRVSGGDVSGGDVARVFSHKFDRAASYEFLPTAIQSHPRWVTGGDNEYRVFIVDMIIKRYGNSE